MSGATKVEGFVAPGFEAVREAFARNFEQSGEVGAACAVYRDGEPIVDLWGGLADPETARPWERDTLVLIFSATKGIAATLIHRLVERGVLALDRPIAEVWPEFGVRGKQAITLRHVLTHRAGLAAIDGDLTLADVYARQPVADAIAAQAPNWEPGTKHGYHARSYGWILGEVVRRVTGRSLGELVRDEIARPLGLDLFIGTPASEDPRIARTLPSPPPEDPAVREAMDAMMGPDTLLGRVLSGPSNLFSYGDLWNERGLRGTEMPSSNGISTARSLARFYAATFGEVDGIRLLEPETLERATAVQVEGPDAVIGVESRLGLGFMLPPMLGTHCSAASFGHPGAGGALAFADPEAGIAFGYVPNQMKMGMTGDERSEALTSALYRALDGAR